MKLLFILIGNNTVMSRWSGSGRSELLMLELSDIFIGAACVNTGAFVMKSTEDMSNAQLYGN